MHLKEVKKTSPIQTIVFHVLRKLHYLKSSVDKDQITISSGKWPGIASITSTRYFACFPSAVFHNSHIAQTSEPHATTFGV
jgi:hypothetical protein